MKLHLNKFMAEWSQVLYKLIVSCMCWHLQIKATVRGGSFLFHFSDKLMTVNSNSTSVSKRWILGHIWKPTYMQIKERGDRGCSIQMQPVWVLSVIMEGIWKHTFGKSITVGRSTSAVTGGVPFRCNLCEYGCDYGRHLKTHMREKQYSGQIKVCDVCSIQM